MSTAPFKGAGAYLCRAQPNLLVLNHITVVGSCFRPGNSC